MLKSKQEDYDVLIPPPGGEGSPTTVTIQVTVEWDDAIQEWLLTPESVAYIEATKARHMGLLSPEELKSLRFRLGLSQEKIGELLQIGKKTWTRWETGKQRPSRSVNLLLRALYDGELSVEYLEQINQPPPDWSRALYGYNISGLRSRESIAMAGFFSSSETKEPWEPEIETEMERAS